MVAGGLSREVALDRLDPLRLRCYNPSESRFLEALNDLKDVLTAFRTRYPDRKKLALIWLIRVLALRPTTTGMVTTSPTSSQSKEDYS